MVGELLVDGLVSLGCLAVEAGGSERARLDFEVCFGFVVVFVALLDVFVAIFLLLPGAFPLAKKYEAMLASRPAVAVFALECS